MEESKIIIHKHFEMGRAPYRLVGIWSAPSTSVLEQNPTAYNAMMNERPRYCRMCCDYCSTGIRHHFIIEDAEKKRFSVGSTCIDKLGQVELVTQAQKMEKERQRQLRQLRAEKKRAEQQAKYEQEIEEQRNKNGGLTDHELLVQERKAREERNRHLFIEHSEFVVQLLEQSKGNFCENMIDQLHRGTSISPGAKTIIIEIMAKNFSGSRKNSKAYRAALPKMKDEFEKLEAALEKIKTDHQAFLSKSFGFK